jgi:hypothetical protein
MEPKQSKNTIPEKRRSVKKSEAQDTEKLVSQWERKLKRFGLGVLPPLGRSEGFTRLHGDKLDKCKWHESFENIDQMEYEMECFQRALKKLSYRERTIVMLHCGIEDKYCYTFNDIGKIFKITNSRASQIYEKAKRKLFDLVASEVVNQTRRKNTTNQSN